MEPMAIGDRDVSAEDRALSVGVLLLANDGAIARAVQSTIRRCPGVVLAGQCGFSEDIIDFLEGVDARVVILALQGRVVYQSRPWQVARVCAAGNVLACVREIDDEVVKWLIESGVRGVVSSTAGPCQMMLALSAVGRGDFYWEECVGAAFLHHVYCDDARLRLGSWTPTESVIVGRLAEGDDVKAIAFALGRHRTTVEYHLHSAMVKLGAKTKAALIALVARCSPHASR